MNSAVNHFPLSAGHRETPLTCYLCDGKKNIRWRCIDCNFKICGTCQIIHANARSSANHCIISFDDIDCCLLDLKVKSRIKKLRCPRHPHQNYSLACRTCDNLICESCIPKNHEMHDIHGLDYFLEERMKIEGLSSKILPKGFLARSPSQEEHFGLQKGVKSSSLHQEEHYDFLEDLSALSPRQEDNFEHQKGFLARSLSQEQLFDVKSVDFCVIHQLVVQLPVVFFLKMLSEDIAWIGCTETSDMLKIKLPIKSKYPCLRLLHKKLDKEIECVQLDCIEGFNVLDIALNREDILFISHQDSDLHRAFTDTFGQRQIHSLYSFHPSTPTCLHFDSDKDQMWVGLKDLQLTTAWPFSTCKVISISTTWRETSVFELSTSGRRLFTFPFRITNTSNHLLVLDRQSPTTGRVISLNSYGHCMWEYNSPQNTSLHVKPFFPTGIATTKQDKIAVIDGANNAIHVLNIAGKIIVYNMMADIGIERSFSVDVDRADKLWIGSAQSSENNKAKIHVIQMTFQDILQ